MENAGGGWLWPSRDSKFLQHENYRDVRYATQIVKRSDILVPGTDDRLDANARKAKRRKIGRLAKDYLAGKPLFIASATLKGPFAQLSEGRWSSGKEDKRLSSQSIHHWLKLHQVELLGDSIRGKSSVNAETEIPGASAAVPVTMVSALDTNTANGAYESPAPSDLELNAPSHLPSPVFSRAQHSHSASHAASRSASASFGPAFTCNGPWADLEDAESPVQARQRRLLIRDPEGPADRHRISVLKRTSRSLRDPEPVTVQVEEQSPPAVDVGVVDDPNDAVLIGMRQAKQLSQCALTPSVRTVAKVSPHTGLAHAPEIPAPVGFTPINRPHIQSPAKTATQTDELMHEEAGSIPRSSIQSSAEQCGTGKLSANSRKYKGKPRRVPAPVPTAVPGFAASGESFLHINHSTPTIIPKTYRAAVAHTSSPFMYRKPNGERRNGEVSALMAVASPATQPEKRRSDLVEPSIASEACMTAQSRATPPADDVPPAIEMSFNGDSLGMNFDLIDQYTNVLLPGSERASRDTKSISNRLKRAMRESGASFMSTTSDAGPGHSPSAKSSLPTPGHCEGYVYGAATIDAESSNGLKDVASISRQPPSNLPEISTQLAMRDAQRALFEDFETPEAMAKSRYAGMNQTPDKVENVASHTITPFCEFNAQMSLPSGPSPTAQPLPSTQALLDAFTPIADSTVRNTTNRATSLITPLHDPVATQGEGDKQETTATSRSATREDHLNVSVQEAQIDALSAYALSKDGTSGNMAPEPGSSKALQPLSENAVNAAAAGHSKSKGSIVCSISHDDACPSLKQASSIAPAHASQGYTTHRPSSPTPDERQLSFDLHSSFDHNTGGLQASAHSRTPRARLSTLSSLHTTGPPGGTYTSSFEAAQRADTSMSMDLDGIVDDLARDVLRPWNVEDAMRRGLSQSSA